MKKGKCPCVVSIMNASARVRVAGHSVVMVDAPICRPTSDEEVCPPPNEQEVMNENTSSLFGEIEFQEVF